MRALRFRRDLSAFGIGSVNTFTFIREWVVSVVWSTCEQQSDIKQTKRYRNQHLFKHNREIKKAFPGSVLLPTLNLPNHMPLLFSALRVSARTLTVLSPPCSFQKLFTTLIPSTTSQPPQDSQDTIRFSLNFSSP